VQRNADDIEALVLQNRGCNRRIHAAAHRDEYTFCHG
jgi:hypothetical protein